jgi:mono/diheme cytochrome c family protein
MAATDQKYRNQRALDVVFGASCVLLLLSMFWMLYDDFARPFKRVQREFRDVETALYQQAMLEKFPADQMKNIEQAQGVVNEARQKVNDAKANLKDRIREVMAAREGKSPESVGAIDPNAWLKEKELDKARLDAAYQDTKATYDSEVSIYNIAVDDRDNAAPGDYRKKLEREVQQKSRELEQLAKKLDDLQRKLAENKADTDEALKEQKKAEEGLSQAQDNLKKLTADFDRFAKTTAQKKWKAGDWFRALPIIDGFASPYRIQQISLPDLTIEYGSFKDVPRYDRCTTCHLGIERPTFDADSLRKLKLNDDAKKELEERNKEALAFLQKRYDEARKLKKEGQSAEELGFDPSDLPSGVRSLDLKGWQVKQYCAHPRLDLFVDANSPHPAEKFGCTTCHNGQGSATDFALASHTPNDVPQRREWQKEHDWEANHFWDFPMLPARFVESGCLKCHHQVTDLVRQGSKEEAPKLLKGYNLVREFGCFGCHDISGTKRGQEVGPDLRTEPSPPLEALTPEERARLEADTANPPGTMRKVGPSLRRISEKTNEGWARKWIESPRGFRPDTRMPHFYGLSNNDPGRKDAENRDVVPDDQKAFPAAEITSIAHYLFAESREYLKGTDKYRLLNEARKKELEDLQRRGTISDKQRKELLEVTRRLELAVPPTPLSRQVIDEHGQAVKVPAAGDQKSRAEGRRLFAERGCLACHNHAGTETASPGSPAVSSDAHFGPSLTRLAAKVVVLKPNGEKDAEASRRWLVQWVLNPNVHHPRTRMPITHLTPEQAGHVADWLLSQDNDEVKSWLAGPDVPAPSFEDLRSLARVYLKKGAGVGELEVEQVLKPAGEGRIQGFTPERAQAPLMAADADEQTLVARPNQPIDANTLQYYIGKKAVSRLGCFGCHDIPGFEGAKPIGTPLNDWGKKDPERLAFEDIAAYVKDHYNIVDARDDAEDRSKPAADWHDKDGKPPYEKFFADAVMSHKREGFLHQKLQEPRSYDYHRDLKWDDRLRMPRFQFARTIRKAGESDEDFQNRVTKEEAEAREAVMTFILGLVAEPVSAKYLPNPTPDRLAEVRGRQVLDKFNCAGCHQVRSGVFEFKLNDDTRDLLDQSYDKGGARATLPSDHVFPDHNAWVSPPASGDRAVAFGTSPQLTTLDGREVLVVRLSHALGYTTSDGKVRELPAATRLRIAPEAITARSDPFGGTFADLMVSYLARTGAEKYKLDPFGDNASARASVPPPLVREGERVQPDWLFNFLREPFEIRPATILRMPKFNMSEEEARALVGYFAGADRSGNPGIGLMYPYLTVGEREDTYWQKRDREYVERLAREKKLDDRAKKYLDEAEKRLKAAKETAEATKDEAGKKAAEKERDDLEAEVKALKEAVEKKDDGAVARRLEGSNLYWTDAYRLLATSGKSFCVECHNAGAVKTTKAKEDQGPPLELSFNRLRPDWTERWFANPKRLLTYDTAMPQNFGKDQSNLRDLFEGSSLEQVQALRDVLMNFSKVADMPVNRSYRAATSGGKK